MLELAYDHQDEAGAYITAAAPGGPGRAKA
jgi:hypothetical protein